MFSIANDGQAIKATNYWESDDASAGYCFLSHNAAALRLLVPKARSYYLPVILAGKKVTIERSVLIRGCFDIVFEDGTDMPFCIAMSTSLMDFKLWKTKHIPFTVWNESGLVKAFAARVKI